MCLQEAPVDLFTWQVLVEMIHQKQSGKSPKAREQQRVVSDGMGRTSCHFVNVHNLQSLSPGPARLRPHR